MSKLVKRNKKQKGGAINALKILLDMDSFHDFWKGNNLDNKLKAILQWGLLRSSIKYFKLTETLQFPPYTFKDEGGRRVAVYPKLPDWANYMVSNFPAPFNGINISDVEKTTAKVFGIPIDPSENGSTGMYNLAGVGNTPQEAGLIVQGVQAGYFELTKVDLANGNNIKFANIVRVALGDAEIVGDYVHILCDAGFGNMGKVGRASGRLRGIITPQVIADSANTPSGPISENNPNIYYAPETTPQSFDSDSNVFTKDKYSVSYENDGMCENEKTNFSLVIKSRDGSLVNQNFAINGWSQGPSAAVLASCYILKTLEPYIKTGTEFVYDQDVQVAAAVKEIATKHTNMVDIWKLLGDKNVDPDLFLDLKRGGDRDQMVAALIASKRFNNLIFCTGDLLCAVAAIINGLATVYQVSTTKKSYIKVWRKGFIKAEAVAAAGIIVPFIPYTVGGAVTRSQAARARVDAALKRQPSEQLGALEVLALQNNQQLITNAAAAEAANGHNEVSEDVVEDEKLTAEDLIRDISSQAADFIKTQISKVYPPINVFSQLVIILDEFNRIIELGTKLAAAGQPPNPNMLTPLNTAINALRLLTNTDYPLVDLNSVQERQAYYTGQATVQLEHLNTPPELTNQAKLRHDMLYSLPPSLQFINASKDIYGFLIDKYNNNFATDPIFQAFKLILDPYSSVNPLTPKIGYFGNEPKTYDEVKKKNLYVVGLVALTLLNDMISGSFTRKTSVATTILYGASYTAQHLPPLTEGTAIKYDTILGHITRALVLYTDINKPLVPTEVYGLITGGNRRIRKTLKRFKIIRRKKHQKTYRKQK